MGWGRRIRRLVRRATNFLPNVGASIDKAVGTGEFFEKSFDFAQNVYTGGAVQAAEWATDAATHVSAANEKEKKEKAAAQAEESAAKAKADSDYYTQVMSARNKQVASYLGSQTDYTSEGDSLGNYGVQKLGSYGDSSLGTYKRKKTYY